MPWQERETMDLKEEFVIRAQKGQQSFSTLCAEYQISRKTGYKWLNRFLEEDLHGLEDRSRRPHSSPDHLDESAVCRIIRLKKNHLRWGAKKSMPCLFGSIPIRFH